MIMVVSPSPAGVEPMTFQTAAYTFLSHLFTNINLAEIFLHFQLSLLYNALASQTMYVSVF